MEGERDKRISNPENIIISPGPVRPKRPDITLESIRDVPEHLPIIGNLEQGPIRV